MALQSLSGEGLYLPRLPRVVLPPAFLASALDASTEKFAWSGRMWNSDHATKTIDRVGFLFGTVTKPSGTVIRVSLQDVSLTAGSPMQPDETVDQFRDVPDTDAGFASNLWYRTGLLTSDGTDGGTKRTVAYNELLSVVVEYETFQTGAVVQLRNPSATENTGIHQAALALKTTIWGDFSPAGIANLVLEFNDGTWGTLRGAFPCSAFGTLAFNVGTAGADEYALAWQLPGPGRIDGGWVVALYPTTPTPADFEITLYLGTQALATTPVSGYHSSWRSGVRLLEFSLSDTPVARETLYRLGFRPTATSNLTLYYFDVADAGHLQCHGGGTNWALTSRLNQGDWAAPTTTRRLFTGIALSAFEDGVVMPRTRPLRRRAA